MAATQPITLKLVVDKDRNRIAFAESDKVFVDVLLSFLTLPIGTIVRLMNKQSSLGCMDKLYEGVECLDKEFFLTEACRAMLISPVNSSILKCNRLQVNIDRMNDLYSYPWCSCNNQSSPLLSFNPNTKCICGGKMSRRLMFIDKDKVDYSEIDGVFVKRTRFVIRDDLVIAPVQGILSLLDKLSISHWSNLEEKLVTIEHAEVLHLLKRLLVSRTPLTDVFLRKEAEISPEVFRMGVKSATNNTSCPQTPNENASDAKKISLKLVLVKNKKVLYAEVNRDFVDLLFSFLTFPMGAVKKHLGSQCCITSLNNLYASAEYLSSMDCIVEDCKERLLNPKLPQHFGCMNQVIAVEEEELQFHICQNFNHLSAVPDAVCPDGGRCAKTMRFIDPRNRNIMASDGGYCKEFMYMVTDELVVTPLSMMEAISLCKGTDERVEEAELSVGEEEALALLNASVTSKTALTDAFLSRVSCDGGAAKKIVKKSCEGGHWTKSW